jgi:ribosomal protein S17
MARSELQGEISRVSGAKTFRVTVMYKKVHPIYRKIVSYKRSFLAHSEQEHAVGDKVSIVPSSRRLSKMKHYQIVEEVKVTSK